MDNVVVPQENALIPRDKTIRPVVSDEHVIYLVRRHFRLGPLKPIKELISYDDRNYLIEEEETSKKYILKILNSLDSKIIEPIEGQNALLIYLNSNGIACPTPIKNVHNTYYTIEKIPENPDEDRFVVRLMDFVPGEILFNIKVTNGLFFNVGKYLARMDHIQNKFSHFGFDKKSSIWMMEQMSGLTVFVPIVDNEESRLLVNQVIISFEKRVKPQMDKFKKGVIHGDFNEHNILLSLKESDSKQKDSDVIDGDLWYPTGILDFGDAQYSCYIFELSIAAAYAALHSARQSLADCDLALEALANLVAGFLNLFPLDENELEVLQLCVCCRISQSLVMGAYTSQQDPENAYVLSSASIGWTLLKYFWRLPMDIFDKAWKDRCIEPAP